MRDPNPFQGIKGVHAGDIINSVLMVTNTF